MGSVARRVTMGRSLQALLLFWLLFWGVAGAAAQPASSRDHEVGDEIGDDVADEEIGDDAAGDDEIGDRTACDDALGRGAEVGTRRAGDFGVGGEATLGGTTGIHARLMLGEAVGLQLTLGVATSVLTPDMTSESNRVTSFGGGGALLIRVLGWDGGQAALLLGFDFLSLSTSDIMLGDTAGSVFRLSGGLFAEAYLEPYLSLHGQAGVRMGFRTGDEDGYFIDAGGDLFTGFGFTFWLI